MQPQDLISELGNTLGIALQATDGACQIIFDTDTVNFEEAEGVLFAFADIASASGREDAFERLLQANFAGQETGGAVLSVQNETFMLHIRFDKDSSYAEFENGLERFIKSLRYWKEWLALPPKKDSAAKEPLPMPNMIRI